MIRVLTPVFVALALSTSAVAQAAEVQGEGAAYFPRILFATSIHCMGHATGSRRVMTPFEADWYAEQLRAAGEATMADNDAPGVLRFTWLRTFNAPVIVRIDPLPGGGARMTAKQLSGKGGYSPGTIARQTTRDLTRQEQSRLAALLKKQDPFALPPRGCELMSDGAEWLLETTGPPEGYQFVARQSPKSGPVRALGLLLLDLTGWKVDPVY